MVKNQLSQKAKLNVYHSLIHSHLDYCAMIWISSIRKKQLNMLKVIQKKALRVVFGTRYNAHTSGLFQSTGITKVENQLSFSYIYFPNSDLPRNHEFGSFR